MGEAAIRTVMVIGLGVMGRGIVASLLRGGFKVTVLSRRGEEARRELPDGVTVVTAAEGAAPDLVIETIPEKADLKREIYAQVEDAWQGAPILATNTSGLPIQGLADTLRYPARFAALHYCQPADVVPLVEVAPARQTDPSIPEALAAMVRACGQIPLVLGQAPDGLLINRLQHALLHEAYYLIDRGIASAEDIDIVARKFFGPRMSVTGMIEQKDLSGLDTHAYAQAAIVPHLHHGSEPSPVVQGKLRDNELGVKTGRGFYDWSAVDTAAYRTEAKARLDRVLAFLEKEEATAQPHPPAAAKK